MSGWSKTWALMRRFQLLMAQPGRAVDLYQLPRFTPGIGGRCVSRFGWLKICSRPSKRFRSMHITNSVMPEIQDCSDHYCRNDALHISCRLHDKDYRLLTTVPSYVMERPITGFELDSEGDPIAILSCGHAQHVRHNPPFINRPWVTSEEGRNGMLGKMLNCVRCDNFEMPDSFIAYKRTPVFTEESVPDALRKDHQRKSVSGQKYRFRKENFDIAYPPFMRTWNCLQDKIGIVVPEVLHNVEPLGTTVFLSNFTGTG